MLYRKYVNRWGMTVLLPEVIFNEIKMRVAAAYPREFGGIFVGRIVDGRHAVIERMRVPRRFFATPVLFRRISDFLNIWLLKIFHASGGEMIYLGEWHSHPDAQPLPSVTDHQAMVNIVQKGKIRLQTPLLFIVGYHQHSYDERLYIFFDNQLHAYDKVV